MNTIKSTKPIQRQKIILNDIDNQFNQQTNKLIHLKNQLNRFHSPNPYNRYFVWTGLFADGEIISEIDYKTHRDVDFKEFRLKNQNPNKQLINFGLVGAGYFFYYNTYNGNFVLNDKEIKIIYKVENNAYQLTDAFNINYNDAIAYKEAECNFAPFGESNGGDLKSVIYEYNFGYKQTLQYSDGTIIKFQPIVHVPINGNIYINIRLVCLNNSLDGELIIMKNGRIMSQQSAPLEIKKGGEINWEIK